MLQSRSLQAATLETPMPHHAEHRVYDMSCSNSRRPSSLTHAAQQLEYEAWAEQCHECHECLRVRGPPSTLGRRSASPLCRLLSPQETSARRVRYCSLHCIGCTAAPCCAVDMRTLGMLHEQPVACTANNNCGWPLTQLLVTGLLRRVPLLHENSKQNARQ